MHKNVHPDYYNKEAGAAPSYYIMYKDILGVERVLLNQYGNDLVDIPFNPDIVRLKPGL